MPIPFNLAVSPPAVNTDEDLARIHALMSGVNPLQDPGYLGVLGQLEGMLGSINAQPAPVGEPVPSAPNPLASMAAIFAGSLADTLGQHGVAANAREQIAAREAAPAAALARNRQLQQMDMIQRQQRRLEVLGQIAEAKAEAAKRANDWLTFEKETQRSLMLEDKRAKNDLALEQVKQGEITAGKLAVEKERGAQRRQTNAERILLEQSTRGGGEQGKAILAEADAKADAMVRRSQEMRDTNAAATAAFNIPPYSETEIRIEEAREQVEIDRIYREARAKLAGAPSAKTETSKVSASAQTLDAFFKQ